MHRACDEARVVIPSLGSKKLVLEIFKCTGSQLSVINTNIIPKPFLFGFVGSFFFFASTRPYLPNNSWLRLTFKHKHEQQLRCFESARALALVLPGKTSLDVSASQLSVRRLGLITAFLPVTPGKSHAVTGAEPAGSL